jgi:GDP-L-fucose synthase
MNILITGAVGMVGSAIVRSLEGNSEFSVTGLSRSDVDLRDSRAFSEKLAKIKPDVVLHTAARVGGIQANIAQPVDFLASNLQMDTSVITSCLEAGIENLVYFGSNCMYPKDYRQPLIETDILAGPLEPTNEGNALAKISGAKLCEYASASMGVNYKTIIPSNLYGPGDNFQPGSSHLLASIIRKVSAAKDSGSKTIDVWGSGAARREFTYIQDLSDWLASTLNRLSELPSVLNVGAGIDHSVDEFYLRTMKAMGVEAKLVHDLGKPEGMRAKLLDSSLARREHGWVTPTSLETGIHNTLQWFRAQAGR